MPLPVNPAAASTIKPQGASLQGQAWREFIGTGSGNNWEGSLANDQSQCVVIYEVPWGSRIPDEKAILGYPTRSVDPITGFPRLQRNLPAGCPYYPGRMWASRAGPIKGIGPHKDVAGKEVAVSGGIDCGSRMVYETARLTVLFTQRPYKVYSDSYLAVTYPGFPAPEKFRFVERQTKASSRFGSTKDSTFTFAEAPASPTAIGGSGIGKIEARTDVTLIWHEVPAACIMDVATGLLTNINKCVGKLNLYNWPTGNGYQPGTILVEAPECDPILAAADAIDVQNLPVPVDGDPALIYKVTFHLTHFDPTPGPTSQYRGHNLAPWPNDFNSYLVTSNPNASGLPPFPVTSISLASHNQTLPQATINVVSTTGSVSDPFTVSGSVTIATSGGLQTVTYTGVTPTSFTGCAGGTGKLYYGDIVQQVDPNGKTYGRTIYDYCDLNLLFFIL